MQQTEQHKKNSTRWRALRWVAALAACAAAGCSRQAQANSGSGSLEAFPILSPVVTDAVHERRYVAEVRAKQRAEVRSRIKGFIESVAVDEGQTVAAGQLLFSIDANELKQQARIARATVRRTEAELKAARLECDGTRLLSEKNVVSPAELALAESKVESLEAALEEARATLASINLEYAEIRAPFAGVVNRIPRRAGSPIDDSQPLTTITDTREVYAYFRVAEAEYLELTALADAEREVWLELADGTRHPSAGVIDAIESEFDQDTGNIAFRARFANEAGRLKHGSTATLIVETGLDDALLVPQKSTFEVQEQLYVYVVDDQHTARARRIVPKLRLDDAFVVASGLTASDQIVSEGVQKLRDGMRVKALPASATQGG